MSQIYNNPRYYEIAFSFRDIPREVDVLEEAMRQYSGIPVQSVLEIGCGNSPHMGELLQRGYVYTGLDINEAMLQYSAAKARRLGYQAVLVPADLKNFSLDAPVDFVCTMLGSLYVSNTRDLLSHFRCVSSSLKAGGLYFLDWCVDFTSLANAKDSWELEAEGIRVHVDYATFVLNIVDQTYEEVMELNINDRGKHINLRDIAVRRVIYPQEFLLLIEMLPQFEFVGWWNNWDLTKPLTGEEETISRPIILIRKTQ